ncbi:hypothetical protein N7488_004718 [Penicillium malachiteum]|nr:hypothetical protein N7488_004718 [Penicillium malachiteum]
MSQAQNIQSGSKISPDIGLASGNGGLPKAREKARRRNRNDDVDLSDRLMQMKEDRDAVESSFQDSIGGQRLPLRAKQSGRKCSRFTEELQSEESDSESDEGFLEPTPLAIQDAAYGGNDDSEVKDIGLQIGRMRLGERVGGLYRPRIADEVDFIFGHNLSDDSPIHEIPSRGVSDKLLEQHWHAVHPVARILHRPTFFQQYETLWEAIEEECEGQVAPPQVALVFSVLLSAVISMSEVQVHDSCQLSREDLKNRLKFGVEASLSRAQLLSTTRVDTLQAFIAYLVDQQL